MATLSTDRRSGKVAGYNIQWFEGGRRHTIHLGGKQYAKKTAAQLKEIVETLLYNRRNSFMPDRKLEHWLQNASSDMQAKLANAGLIIVHKAKTCQQLWDSFLKFKETEVKKKTMDGYRECRACFFEMFRPDESIEAVTLERLVEWKVSLLEGYASTSVAGHIKNLKVVLNWATDQEWLTKNPANKLPRGNFRNRDNDRFITMAEYAKLLDACPNQDWRSIIALARIGGLRCPSELRQLRWTDINWSENRFLVRSPKTEHHERHRERLVLLFDELREELEQKDKTTEFVVQSFQGKTWKLNSPFQKIAESAGLGKVTCPFVNMRRSRSNEVRRRWGSALESLWIGHSEDTMDKHYLQPLDDDFVVAEDLGDRKLHAKSHAVGYGRTGNVASFS